MKHFKNILKETDEEKTNMLCVINAKEKIILDQENHILETNDCLYLPPKLMTTMIEKHSNEKDKIEVSDGSVNRFRLFGFWNLTEKYVKRKFCKLIFPFYQNT